MTPEEKIRENRLRRAASRQGLKLEKSKARDSRANDWSTYQLSSIEGGTLVAYGLQSGYGLNLDEIENILDAAGGPSIWKKNHDHVSLYDGPACQLKDVEFTLYAEYDDDNGVHFFGNMNRKPETYTLAEVRKIHRAMGKVLDKVTADPKPAKR